MKENRIVSKMRGIFRRIVQLVGFDIVRYDKYSRIARSIHSKEFVEFNQIYKQVGTCSTVSANRLFLLFQFLRYAAMLPGEVAEFGVYKGGSAKLLALTARNKRIHLFDTFEGMPITDPCLDGHKIQDFHDTSFAQVQDFLKDCSNVILHKGFFPDSTKDLGDVKFCFVYIDADLYKSTKDALAYFYDHLVPGGILVVDDFCMPFCRGIEKAIYEFLEGKPEKLIHTTEAQCVIIKI